MAVDTAAEISQGSQAFPSEYSKFHKIDTLPGDVSRMHTYRKAGELAWTGILMNLDRHNAYKGRYKLKTDLQAMRPYDEDAHAERVGQYWDSIRESSFYPKFTELREEVRKIHYEPDELELDVLPWVQKDVREAGATSEQLEYVTALQKMLSARKKAAEPVIDRFLSLVDEDFNFRPRTHESVVAQYRKPEVFDREISKLLRQTEPYAQYDEAATHRIKGMEETLFGEDKDTATELWRATVYLKTSELPAGISGSQKRKPLLELLVRKDYKAAKLYLEEVYAKYPQVANRITTEKLGLEPDSLRQISQEIKAEEAEERRLRNEPVAREKRNEAARERWREERAEIRMKGGEIRTEEEEEYARENARREERSAEIWRAERLLKNNKLAIRIDQYVDKELCSPDGRTIRVGERFLAPDGSVSYSEGSTRLTPDRVDELLTQGWTAGEINRKLIVNGELLKTLRTNTHLSQKAIADMAGLAQKRLDFIERGGEIGISWFGIVRIAEKLGTDPTGLVATEQAERLRELMEKYPESERPAQRVTSKADVTAIIMNQISEGTLKGDLPSTERLAEALGTAPSTTYGVIRELADDGVIKRIGNGVGYTV